MLTPYSVSWDDPMSCEREQKKSIMADSGSMIAININTLTFTYISKFCAVGIADLGSS